MILSSPKTTTPVRAFAIHSIAPLPNPISSSDAPPVGVLLPDDRSGPYFHCGEGGDLQIRAYPIFIHPFLPFNKKNPWIPASFPVHYEFELMEVVPCFSNREAYKGGVESGVVSKPRSIAM